MKRLSIFLYVLLLTIFSCEKDETRVVLKSDATPPAISAPAADSKLVITQPTLADEVDFTWSDTDYGVNTEVTYTVEIDSKCNSFSNPIVIGATTATSLPITMEALNSKLINDFKLAPHQLSELQLRVRSLINNKFESISAPVAFSIKPWSDKPVALWVGENSVTAPVVFATSKSTYEGFRYLTEGTSFRFANNTICADSVFGTTGTAGELAFGSTSAVITVATTGHYKINVDTKNMTYSLVKVNTWGLIGTATPGGWNTSTPFDYNEETGVWEKELVLINGALKFRANNGWDINYGTADINELTDSLVFDAGAIDIAESGNYIVRIDFSQATAPYVYKYSVSKSSNVPEPAKLWLPGSYQGWSPSTAPTIYAVNSTTYEGHVYIPAGAGFKFTSAPDWDHINYGDSGTPDLLSIDGQANGLSLTSGGYYRFIVNTNTLAYKIDLINSMGLVGPATLGGSDNGWNASVPMTYNETEDVWTITYNLSPGAVKFRANNAWTINYGPADSNALEGTIIFDASSAVNITEAGSYTVTLDFSRSVAPYKYTYTIKKN